VRVASCQLPVATVIVIAILVLVACSSATQERHNKQWGGSLKNDRGNSSGRVIFRFLGADLLRSQPAVALVVAGGYPPGVPSLGHSLVKRNSCDRIRSADPS